MPAEMHPAKSAEIRPLHSGTTHKGKVVLTVPTYMRSLTDWEMTERTLYQLMKTVPEGHTICVVDDASPDRESLIKLHEFVGNAIRERQTGQFWAGYYKGENQGFANSVNYGLRMALENEMHCLLVNADMEFPQPNWFDIMVDTDAWVVGAKLLYPIGLIQHAGVYFSVVTRTFDHLHKLGPADLKAANFKRKCPVTGALQFIRHEAIQKVGLYDEEFKMGWEDVDYCLRVFFEGGTCIYNPEVVATHYESVFRGNRNDKLNEWTQLSFERLFEKHAGRGFGDFVPMLIGRDPMAGSDVGEQ